METLIDIESDFFTFRKQVVEQLGDFYKTQAEMFLERATNLAEKGFLQNAISDALFAELLSQYTSDTNYPRIYVVGLLTQLYIDTADIEKAKTYCDTGMRMLDPEEDRYEQNLEYFLELNEKIENYPNGISEE